MYPINSWQDIGALASAAAASIAMIAIGLAWAAAVIAKRSTDIGRRGYLDAIFDPIIVARGKFDLAELPFWREIPDEGRIRNGDYSTALSGTQEYENLHETLQDTSAAIERLRRSGLCEVDLQVKGKRDDAFDDMLTLFQASCWASYFNVVNGSKAESTRWLETSATGDNPGLSQPILEAWKEVEIGLANSMDLDANSVAIRIARDRALDAYKNEVLVSALQLIDNVRSNSFNDVCDRYRLIADAVAPWHKKPRKPWTLSSWLKELRASLKLPSWLKKLRKSWRLRKSGLAANQ